MKGVESNTDNDRPEKEPVSQFQILREVVHKQMGKELNERIKRKIPATREEVIMGAFREMLEPQVRDAAYELYRKGYSTESSGFGGENGEIQSIDGVFTIDETTRTKLKEIGVDVLNKEDVGMPYGENRVTLCFKSETPDIQKMAYRWKQVAALLPDLGKSAEPSLYGLSFQEEFAPQHTDIMKARIERMLKEMDEQMSPENKQELEQKLSAIKSVDAGS